MDACSRNHGTATDRVVSDETRLKEGDEGSRGVLKQRQFDRVRSRSDASAKLPGGSILWSGRRVRSPVYGSIDCRESRDVGYRYSTKDGMEGGEGRKVGRVR